jgi:hypothetical protein
MKKITIYLFAIAILPLNLLAQDTAVVKQQANILAQAMIAGDYATIINHTYPKAVQMAGGKQKMISIVNQGMAQMKTQGVIFESATVGSPGKFYKAGAETHCLVPENLTIKLPNAHIISHSYLLAISKDGGKTWSFLDLNNSSSDKIKQLIPNFNPALQIPKSTTEQIL